MMDMDRGEEKDEEDWKREEQEELRKIKLYGLMDIEGTKIPRMISSYLVVPSIVGLLDHLGHQGTFSLQAVVGQFTRQRICPVRRKELEACGVKITAMKEANVPDVAEQIADDEIIRRCNVWLSQSSEESRVLLIAASDKDYADMVGKALASGIHVIFINIPTTLGANRRFYPVDKDGKFRSFNWEHGVLEGNAWNTALFRAGVRRWREITSGEPTDGQPVVSGVDSIVWAEVSRMSGVDRRARVVQLTTTGADGDVRSGSSACVGNRGGGNRGVVNRGGGGNRGVVNRGVGGGFSRGGVGGYGGVVPNLGGVGGFSRGVGGGFNRGGVGGYGGVVPRGSQTAGDRTITTQNRFGALKEQSD